MRMVTLFLASHKIVHLDGGGGGGCRWPFQCHSRSTQRELHRTGFKLAQDVLGGGDGGKLKPFSRQRWWWQPTCITGAAIHCFWDLTNFKWLVSNLAIGRCLQFFWMPGCSRSFWTTQANGNNYITAQVMATTTMMQSHWRWCDSWTWNNYKYSHFLLGRWFRHRGKASSLSRAFSCINWSPKSRALSKSNAFPNHYY